MQKFKVGDKLICKCDDRHGVELYEVVTIIDESNGYITYRSSKGEWCWDSAGAWSDDFELYKENNVELNKTDKYFINVQEYADNAGITLKAAHVELQRWLFDNNIGWGYLDKTPRSLGASLLLITDGEYLGWTNSMSFCIDGGYTEVEFTRKQSVELTPTIKEDLVEFNGKKYSKDKLAKALKLIDESN